MVNDPGDLLSVVNPYVVKTLDDGLHVCLPERVIWSQIYHILFQIAYQKLIDNIFLTHENISHKC